MKKPYTLHIDNEDIKQIKIESDKMGLSSSAWIRMQIKKGLKEIN